MTPTKKCADSQLKLRAVPTLINSRGTGTTIIQFSPQAPIAPPGEALTFFTSSQAGLSTALGVLRSGFVIVGNVPTTDGTIATIGQGSLQVIDKAGHVVATWTDPVFLDGPWDLTIDDHGSSARVFVSNVLNGTVVRLDVAVQSKGPVLLHKTTIANGYTHVPNMAALILGPTGLAYDGVTDTLYVASTNDNAIYAISHASQKTSAAGRGQVAFSDQHLRGPLALRFAPNGDLLTANGDAVNADPLHPSESWSLRSQRGSSGNRMSIRARAAHSDSIPCSVMQTAAAATMIRRPHPSTMPSLMMSPTVWPCSR